MVNPEQLTLRSLRAYELGRLFSASRVALVVVPIAALCLLESQGREACACIAAVLLGAAIWLRWRDREGFESVTTGLIAGALPLAAGLVLARFDFRCGFAGNDTFCTIGSVAIGAIAGGIVMLREARWQRRFTAVLSAGVIAALAAGLGCIRLGAVGVASMAFGIAAGSLVGAALRRSP